MLFKKYINVCYGIDKIWWIYEKTDDKIKESKEVSKNTSEALQNLLDNIAPMSESLKKIYESIDILLQSDSFSLSESMNIQSKLTDEYRKLLWPKYKNNPKGQEAIKIYKVIFLSEDTSIEETVDTISEVFDDKKIPQGIKLKLAKYLRTGILPYIVDKIPSLSDIEVSKLKDNNLKYIYDRLKTFHWKISSMEDNNELVSYQDILYSPEYNSDKNAIVLQNVISEMIWNYNPMLDIDKQNKTQAILIKKYPQYDWIIEYTPSWD